MLTDQRPLIKHLVIKSLNLEKKILDLSNVHQEVRYLLVHFDLGNRLTDLSSLIKIDQVLVRFREKVLVSIFNKG